MKRKLQNPCKSPVWLFLLVFALNACNEEPTKIPQRNKLFDLEAPTVSITSPSHHGALTGTQTIEVSASDNTGIKTVEFFLNDKLIGTVTTPPFTFAWDTTHVAPGNHILTGKAYDEAGNVGVSAAVPVTVIEIYAPTASPLPGLWVTDGVVHTMAQVGNLLYLGGSFSRMGPNVGSGVIVDASTGSQKKPVSWPRIDGQVFASIPSNDGGYYIGGTFLIDGIPKYLIKLTADGSLDSSWNPNPNGRVFVLLKSGDTLYVAGSFRSIGGTQRSGLAALDMSGNATSFDAKMGSNNIGALALSSNALYIAGNLDSVGGQNRKLLAAVHPLTGAVLPWNPSNISGMVSAIAVNNGKLYISGDFSVNEGTSTIENLAAFDELGSLRSWNPAPNFQVDSLLSVNGQLYVGGAFTSIAGQSRNSLAAFDSQGDLTAWNPTSVGMINTLSASSDTLYVGGWPNITGAGYTRTGVAAFSLVSGNLTAWNPFVIGGNVKAISISGNSVFIGGTFSGVGGVTRNGLAAIDLSTGRPTDWDPNVGGLTGSSVTTLAVFENDIYFGGYFSEVGATSRWFKAAVDRHTGTVKNWQPNIGSSISSLVVSNSGILYATYFDGNVHGVAALDSSGTVIWRTTANQFVKTLTLYENTLFVGGYFSQIGGKPRQFAAALDLEGRVFDWNPNITPIGSGRVEAITIAKDYAYLAGYFDSIGGEKRNSLARVNRSSAALDSWHPNPTPDGRDYVSCLAIRADTLYTCSGIIKVYESLNPLPALVDTSAAVIFTSSNGLYIGGGFSSIGSFPSTLESRAGLAFLPPI